MGSLGNQADSGMMVEVSLNEGLVFFAEDPRVQK